MLYDKFLNAIKNDNKKIVKEYLKKNELTSFNFKYLFDTYDINYSMFKTLYLGILDRDFIDQLYLRKKDKYERFKKIYFRSKKRSKQIK